MSEYFPVSEPDNNETVDRKLDPKTAMEEYKSLGPDYMFGAVPLETLDWLESGMEGRLTPEQKYYRAWMRTEHAVGIIYHLEGERPSEEQKLLAEEKFAGAREDLQELLDKPDTKRALQIKALRDVCSLGPLEGMVLDKPDLMIESYNDFYRGLIEAAKTKLGFYQKKRNIEDVPELHSLALLVLSAQNLTSTNNIYAFPAPPRATITDSKDAWTIMFCDPFSAKLWKGRVAPTGAQGVATIPPALLDNEGYPSKHGHGTLQALIDDASTKTVRFGGMPQSDPSEVASLLGINAENAQKAMATGRSLRTLMDHMSSRASEPRFSRSIRPDTPANRHIETVSSKLDSLLEAQFKDMIEQFVSPEEMKTPMSVYLNIPAHRHPSLVDGESLEALISMYETDYSAAELSPEETFVLGWMHVEAGYKGLIDGDATAALFGAFDRAEDLFGETATEFTEQERTGYAYEALLAKSAAKLYKALGQVNHEGFDFMAAREEYLAEITDLAVEALNDYVELESFDDQKEADLRRVLHLLSGILVASVGTYDGHIATLATPRQRGMTETNANGWDLTLWRQTTNGFSPDYYGRARIAERPDDTTLSHGVVTLPQATLEGDEHFSVLRHAIDIVDGRTGDDAMRFDRAVEKLVAAADLAEW